MPSRKDVFKNGRYYHVFDKTIDKKIIFVDDKLCEIFMNTVEFYSFGDHKTSFSEFRRMSIEEVTSYRRAHFKEKRKIVRVLCYTLMPNHYHFLLQQVSQEGIQKFMGNLVNSFTRYFNVMYSRKGPLFLPRFQSVSILSEQQLIYTSKYIHLNPVKADLIKGPENLRNYTWTSYHDYVSLLKHSFIDSTKILECFGNSRARYKEYLI